MIYLVQEESAVLGASPIKIGRTSDPLVRLLDLQTANPRRLVLAGYIGNWMEGRGRFHAAPYIVDDVEQERHYHARLSAHRLVGEWFVPHPDVLAVLREDGTPLLRDCARCGGRPHFLHRPPAFLLRCGACDFTLPDPILRPFDAGEEWNALNGAA